MKKEIRLEFDAISENEGLARVMVAVFISQEDPSMEEINDVKTAVSEAVTNAVIHGYQENGGKIELYASIEDNRLDITISDKGVGIKDIELAMQPLYTSRPDQERSGMGFTFMEAFMDKVEVESYINAGTTVHMSKLLGVEDSEEIVRGDYTKSFA